MIDLLEINQQISLEEWLNQTAVSCWLRCILCRRMLCSLSFCAQLLKEYPHRQLISSVRHFLNFKYKIIFISHQRYLFNFNYCDVQAIKLVSIEGVILVTSLWSMIKSQDWKEQKTDWWKIISFNDMPHKKRSEEKENSIYWWRWKMLKWRSRIEVNNSYRSNGKKWRRREGDKNKINACISHK